MLTWHGPASACCSSSSLSSPCITSCRVTVRSELSSSFGSVVGFAFFVFLLVWQIRHILSSSHPGLRAVESLATIAVLFIVLFALLYYFMGRSDAAGFSQHLDKTTALYFTVTVLSTVGFGDITPATDPARVAVMLQMVMDIILIAVVLRLIVGAAKIGRNRQSDTVTDQPAQETEAAGNIARVAEVGTRAMSVLIVTMCSEREGGQ